MPRLRLSALIVLVAGLLASSCSTGGCGFIFGTGSETATTAARANASADPTAPVVRPRIVALGDSLTVGLGLLETESFPSLLQNKLDEEGYPYEMVNSGVSGDPSAGGLTRLDCHSSLPAEAFYAAHGFKVIGPITIALPGSLAAIEMRRELAGG
mgnify:CR=1 FL=1